MNLPMEENLPKFANSTIDIEYKFNIYQDIVCIPNIISIVQVQQSLHTFITTPFPEKTAASIGLKIL